MTDTPLTSEIIDPERFEKLTSKTVEPQTKSSDQVMQEIIYNERFEDHPVTTKDGLSVDYRELDELIKESKNNYGWSRRESRKREQGLKKRFAEAKFRFGKYINSLSKEELQAYKVFEAFADSLITSQKQLQLIQTCLVEFNYKNREWTNWQLKMIEDSIALRK